MANSRNYRVPTKDDKADVPYWNDLLAQDVAKDVDAISALTPKPSPNETLSFAVTDSDGRRSWLEADENGVPTSHSLGLMAPRLAAPIADQLSASRAFPQTTASESVSFAITDSDGRRSWLEADENGAPTAHALDLINAGLVIPEPVVEAPVGPDNTVEITGVSPARKLYANVAATGRRYLVTAAGDPRNAVATSDGHVLFESNDGPRHAEIGKSGIYPIHPTAELAFWGDSLTDSSGPDYYPTKVSTLLGMPFYQGGVSGQASADIALRQGGLTPAITLAGNSIPAGTTAVAVTAINPSTGYRLGSTDMYTFAGTLAGIPGTLLHDVAANTWSFTRTTAGAVVAVPAGTPFIGTTGTAHENKIQILWPGRNNLWPGDILAECLRDTASMVAYLKPYHKRYVVLSITNGQNEPKGSINYDKILAHNLTLASTYGDRYYDLRRDFVTRGMSIAGLAPTAADTTALAEDRPAPSLMIDTLHPNQAGYEAIGTLVAEFITNKGWTL